MCNNAGKTVVSLLVGAMLGAGMGILFAPDEGTKTRKKIKKSFDDTSDNIKHSVEDFSKNLKAKVKELKGSLEENIETLFSHSSYKADEAIEVLEKKLEQLKKEAAKLQNQK